MKFKKIMGTFFALSLLSGISTAHAQGSNGRGDCMDKYSISYYKVIPGKYDEWLALYKKWHLPIIEYSIKHGGMDDMKFFGVGAHAVSPSWDFSAMFISSKNTMKLTRPQIIEKLFGDKMDEYVAGEKARWSLTTSHWDQAMKQMDPNQEPFSVFEPIQCDK